MRTVAIKGEKREIEDCPFCGARAVFADLFVGHRIRCSSSICNVQTPRNGDIETVISIWNCRANKK